MVYKLGFLIKVEIPDFVVRPFTHQQWFYTKNELELSEMTCQIKSRFLHQLSNLGARGGEIWGEVEKFQKQKGPRQFAESL